jgi:hypothetical protein
MKGRSLDLSAAMTAKVVQASDGTSLIAFCDINK